MTVDSRRPRVDHRHRQPVVHAAHGWPLHRHGNGAQIAPGVFPFRTIDDTRGMIDYATRDDHRRAVVIGGGLLGLEAARGLQSHGIQVDVIHSGRWLMNAQWAAKAGKCSPKHRCAGVGIFTNNRVTTLRGTDKVLGVRLRDETELACDLVVVAAGIRPNTDVATTSGFTVERRSWSMTRCAPWMTIMCSR